MTATRQLEHIVDCDSEVNNQYIKAPAIPVGGCGVK